MLHGYCIRHRSDPPPGTALRGVGDAQVFGVEGGALVMWVSASAAERPTADRLREHETVVRAALRTATPLPLRFGGAFRDEAEVVRLLESRAEEFAAALERLADHAEMSIRITFPAPASAPDPSAPDPAAPDTGEGDAGLAPAGPAPFRSGRAFLERRRTELETRNRVRDESTARLAAAIEPFADLELPTVLSVLASDPLVGGVAHLVHKRQRHRYRDRVSSLRRSRPDLGIAVSGPWAPYSFV